MTIKLQASGIFSAAASPQTVTLPSSYSTKLHDLIVVVTDYSSTTAPTCSGAGATWEQHKSTATSPTLSLNVGYKCTAGNTTITVTGGSSGTGSIIVAIFSGMTANSDPVTAFAGAGTTGASGSIAYTAGQLLIGMAGGSMTGTPPTMSWSNGLTNHHVQNTVNPGQGSRLCTLDYCLPTSKGSTTCTYGGTAQNAIIIAALSAINGGLLALMHS